ncbi:MAG: BrnT family toxin [Acidobacteria bacterium]|nr:BrnT family toxin [Acidobacteriota bacterium]
MDVRYELNGQAFEWDAAKAAQNLRKHSVSFERACEVFFDPFLQLVAAGDSEEMRDAVLGLSEDWSLLFVVHVVRLEESIRIISARSATPAERRTYEYE